MVSVFSREVGRERERVKPFYFVIFNITVRHIILENFIEFPLVVRSEGMKIFFVNVIFINFLDFLTFLSYK